MFNGRVRLFYEEGYYKKNFDRKEALPILKTAEKQRYHWHGGEKRMIGGQHDGR